MKKILLILLLGLFMINLVNAGLIGPFEPGQDIRLIQTCDDCTFNNITTVLYPNGSVAISNVAMEQDGTSFNYTLNSSFTNDLGIYIVNGLGDLNGIDTVWAYDFDVTPTGGTFDTQQGVVVFSLMLLLLFLSAAFLFFGNKSEYLPVKIFLITLGGLFLMFALGFSINSIKQLMLLGSVFSGMFVALYRLILILVSAGFIALVLYLITSVVKAFRKMRGTYDDEDF